MVENSGMGSIGSTGNRGSRTGTPTHFLIYDVETRDYRGVASDGALIVVDEHVFAERVRTLAKKLAVRYGGTQQATDSTAYQRFHDSAIVLLSNADAWRDN